MYRKTSACGRYVARPQQKELEVTELNEEALPIHQQIENLRTKISLKERYNNVLKEELEENQAGATTVLRDLNIDTLRLRQELIDAIGREKFAVQNALRTHRRFQLALRSKTPEFAMGWLDDKLFDFAKKLNVLVEELLRKRVKLQEAEKLVHGIEKWPRPGSLLWEAKIGRQILRVNMDTSNVQVKLEAARLLNIKYKEIKDKLQHEEKLYAPIIRNLDSQLKTQTKELNTLQKMLDDAEYFQAEAVSRLGVTEQEASVNRKSRRLQMARIKKGVEKVLEENTKAGPISSEGSKSGQTVAKVMSSWTREQVTNSHVQLLERTKVKKFEAEKLEIWFSHLVQTVRVHDVTEVPLRLRAAVKLSHQLTAERDCRSKLRQMLTHQRDQLYLILQHIRFSGNVEETEFLKLRSEYSLRAANVEEEVELAKKRLNKVGGTLSSVRTGMISVLLQLEPPPEGAGRLKLKSTSQLIRHLPKLQKKIRELVSTVRSLKSKFDTLPDNKAYSMARDKGPPLPERWLRVQSPHVSDVSEDEDYDDYKVPTRGDILSRSAKVIMQGRLNRGINQN